MLAELTRENFEPLVGQTFKVTTDQGLLDFELTFVEELPTSTRASRRPSMTPKRPPFSLFFTGQTLLPQSMYPMQHDAFGAEPLPIFIVPVGRIEESGRYEYEAVFT